MTSEHGAEPDQANPARVYDALLGGSHNFASDRAFAAEVQETWPGAAQTMRANRAFLSRAVRYLTGEAGIGQFLDIGSGLPTVGNVHEVAQRAAPGTRVAYVDNDPVAVQHSRVLLARTGTAVAIEGDLRRPQAILADPELLSLLDLNRPVGLLLVAVLHFVPDDQDPAAAVAWLRDQIAPGSYLVISHATADGQGENVASAGEIYAQAMPSFQLRSRAGIGAFFGDFELVDPGLVFLSGWRPDTQFGSENKANPAAGYGGVAIKR